MAKKDDYIRLHPEHGLNPTICTCFYCGEDTGALALLGAAYKGEAPRQMVTSLEPCDKCKEKYKDMQLVLEAKPDSDPTKSAHPTGRWFAIKMEAVSEEYRQHKLVMMDIPSFTQTLQDFSDAGESSPTEALDADCAG